MILVTLNVNGKIKLAECEILEQAQSQVKEWTTEGRKNYPNAQFVVSYYEATKIEVAD